MPDTTSSNRALREMRMIYPLPRTTEVEQFRGAPRMDPSLRKRRKLRRRWLLIPPLMERDINYNKHSHANANANLDIHIHSTYNIKLLQINLHHSKVATATLRQQLAERKVDIARIQEPWLYKGQI
jgi:hypothetical protein